jgi:hypothetical protein
MRRFPILAGVPAWTDVAKQLGSRFETLFCPLLNPLELAGPLTTKAARVCRNHSPLARPIPVADMTTRVEDATQDAALAEATSSSRGIDQIKPIHS